MKWKVFLSHGAQDADLAKGLAKKLTEVGVEVVFPPAIELRPRPGEHVLATIESYMRECDEIVVLLTENSIDAPRVVMEMGAAYGMHKSVVPITLGVDDDSFVKDLPSRYTNIERYVEDLRKRTSVSEDKLEKDMLVILQIIKKLQDEGKPRASLTQVSKTLAGLSQPLLAYEHRLYEDALQELLKKGYIKVQTKHGLRRFWLTDKGRKSINQKAITRVLEKSMKVQRKPARSKRARD